VLSNIVLHKSNVRGNILVKKTTSRETSANKVKFFQCSIQTYLPCKMLIWIIRCFWLSAFDCYEANATKFCLYGLYGSTAARSYSACWN